MPPGRGIWCLIFNIDPRNPYLKIKRLQIEVIIYIANPPRNKGFLRKRGVFGEDNIERPASSFQLVYNGIGEYKNFTF